jgi:polar amino acid transport system substrate-binding protein
MTSLRLTWPAFTAMLLAATLLLSGCGSSNSASPTATPKTSGGNTANMGLINPGYLTVGTDASYPPMESSSITNPGQYVGADIDLANALAKAMGLQGAKIVNNSFDTIIPALQRKRFDVVMSSMNDTPAREKQVAFVDYMRASEGIVVTKSSGIHATSYSGMCGKSVAVESGTTELSGLQAANKNCSTPISIKQYTADTDAFQAFRSGHAQAYSGDLPVCLQYVKKNSSLVMAGKPFGAGEDYGIALLKSKTALKSALTRALSTIRSNGEYSRILKKWGVSAASV